MAITRTLIKAVPYNLNNKVEKWDLTMKYEEGTEGKDDYYTNDKNISIEASETRFGPDGDITTNNFTPKAEGDWTKKELEDLCPTAHWDTVFASQYDSVITNPTVNPETNNEFVIPS